MTETTFATRADQRDAMATWYLVDASDRVLGRMAVRIAQVLMGKHKPLYTPHVCVGDGVIVVNASRLKVTGDKRTGREYAHYTGYPGGRRTVTLGTLLDRDPAKLVKLAVRRMLPKSILGKRMLSRLKVYPGPDHPHRAQKPQPLPAAGRRGR